MLIVRCPKCGKDQRTDPKLVKEGDVTKKIKSCVYCGHSFKIHSTIDATRIVKVEQNSAKEEHLTGKENELIKKIERESHKPEFYGTEKDIINKFKNH